MAVQEDGTIIINPYSKLNSQEKLSLAELEAARHYMGFNKDIPISLTPSQQKAFSNYGPPWSQKQTVISRAIVHDPSGLDYTPQQIAYANMVLRGLENRQQTPDISAQLLQMRYRKPRNKMTTSHDNYELIPGFWNQARQDNARTKENWFGW